MSGKEVGMGIGVTVPHRETDSTTPGCCQDTRDETEGGVSTPAGESELTHEAETVMLNVCLETIDAYLHCPNEPLCCFDN